MAIRFELQNEIPSNSTVKNATLSLYFQQGTVGDEHTCAFAFVKSWEEASVTWLQSARNTPWALAGGDFDTTTKVTTAYAPEFSWEHYTVTGIVRGHVSGAPNHGFCVFPDLKDGNSGRLYCSSEYSSEDSLRPKLTVVYENTGINQCNGHGEITQSIQICNAGGAVRFLLPSANLCHITVYNPSGRPLYTAQARGGQRHAIDCSRFSNGVYFVRIVAGSAAYGGRFSHIR